MALNGSLEEDVTYIIPASHQESTKAKVFDENEPLIDTTEALTKRSKKTERALKRVTTRQKRETSRMKATALLDLPPELLEDILGFLQASDVFRLTRVNHLLKDFIEHNENAIAREIIRRRYWILSRCFPLPIPLEKVDSSAIPSLLNERRQDMMQIHKKPYHHVKGFEAMKICTCNSCVSHWNNLCLLLDLSHWQKVGLPSLFPVLPRHYPSVLMVNAVEPRHKRADTNDPTWLISRVEQAATRSKRSCSRKGNVWAPVALRDDPREAPAHNHGQPYANLSRQEDGAPEAPLPLHESRCGQRDR